MRVLPACEGIIVTDNNRNAMRGAKAADWGPERRWA